ncbi:MAG: plasmid stabilization system [Pedosphaera sp.]|nr:plasmid stabilization system [Pedosphaera sp.]
MDFQVLISPRARDDLKVIVRFIGRHNSSAALQFGKGLIEKALSLKRQPWRGRVVPELNESSVRELIFKSYRIIYQISEKNTRVEILRFWHAARGTPEIE